jgi:hypothetical protein
MVPKALTTGVDDMTEAELIQQNAALLAALQAIIEEAGSQMGLDDGPGSVNRMAYIARQAVAA